MGQFDTGIDHWRERLRAHEAELQTYLAGERAYVFQRGERVDVTEQLVKELRSAIAMYHRVIGTYERLYLHQGPQAQRRPGDAIGAAVRVSKIATGKADPALRPGRAKGAKRGGRARIEI